MQTLSSRAGGTPLRLIAPALGALIALGACSDEPIAPKHAAPRGPAAAKLADPFIDVTVTNASGGTGAGSLWWAASQIEPGGGAIHFDPALDGATIALDYPLVPDGPMYIDGPAKGLTISGKDQHRVIESNARVSVRNVTLTKGYADYGSAVQAGSFYMENSTVQDNRGPGSAVRVTYLASLTNSTVSRNVVGGPAVEYGPLAQVFVDHSTIAFNSPGPGLGPNGYPSYSVMVKLHNAIISNNGSPQLNCSSSFNFAYEGTNISNDWSCGEVGITVADPKLVPLANNGGPTMTNAILPQGAAFNAGTACFLGTDQRYVVRDAKCDVGAFEFTDFTKVTLTIDPNVKVDPKVGGQALLAGTVSCTRDEAINLVLELQQDQKLNGKAVVVRGQTRTQTTCGPTARAWSAKLVLPEGSWQSGVARAMASTYGLAEWISPASVAGAVKIAVTRK